MRAPYTHTCFAQNRSGIGPPARRRRHRKGFTLALLNLVSLGLFPGSFHSLEGSMTKRDRTLIFAVMAVAAITAAYFGFLRLSGAPVTAVITTERGEAARESLSGPHRTITVTGPVGKSIIEFQDSRVHMLWSDCPDKICMKMGWIAEAGQVVVCMPNKVVISIRGDAR